MENLAHPAKERRVLSVAAVYSVPVAYYDVRLALAEYSVDAPACGALWVSAVYSALVSSH